MLRLNWSLVIMGRGVEVSESQRKQERIEVETDAVQFKCGSALDVPFICYIVIQSRVYST